MHKSEICSVSQQNRPSKVEERVGRIWEEDLSNEVREVHEEIPNDPSVPVNTIIKALQKIRQLGDLSSDCLNYFFVEDPKFAKFYPLPKVHKHLHNALGGPVISNCRFHTENTSSFSDYNCNHLLKRLNLTLRTLIIF